MKPSPGDRRLRLTALAAVLALAGLCLALLRPPRAPGHGLQASFWDNSSCSGQPRLRRTVRSLFLSADGNLGSSRQVDYCIRYQGRLVVEREGSYQFQLDSDDGSRLFIDGRLVVNNGGIHVRRQRQGSADLAAGSHAVRLEYFQTVGDSFLRVRWRPPGQDGWEEIPLELLCPDDDGSCRPQPAPAGRRWLGILAVLCLVLAALSLLLAWRRWLAGKLGRETWRRGWIVDLACLAVVLPFYLQTIGVRYQHEPFLVGDSPYYANVVISLLGDGDLDQHNQTDRDIFERPSPASRIDMYRSNIALGTRGEWYPKHSIVLPLLSAPCYAAWGGRGLLVFNLLALLLLVVAMRRLATLAAGAGAAAAAAVLLGLTPLFRHFAYSYSADILGALLVVAGFWAAGRRRLLAAGLLLGLATWTKLPNLLALAAVLPLLGGEPGWRRRLLQLGSGASLVLGVFAALNWYRFGAPWITSYSRVLVVNGGQLALADHLAAFNRPFWEGLWLQLFDSGHGLLATTPAAVLALGGFFLLPRRARRPGLGAGLFFLATFLFYCKYDFLTGSSFSNRFLMPALASCALPLGALLQRLVGHGKRRNDSGSGQRT